MNKSIKNTIDNLSRSARNMEDDMEFLEVAPLHQLDIIELMLMGVHHGIQQNTISADEMDKLRLFWNAFHGNVSKLVYINKYYRLLLEEKEIPEDLQYKIDYWSEEGELRKP